MTHCETVIQDRRSLYKKNASLLESLQSLQDSWQGSYKASYLAIFFTLGKKCVFILQILSQKLSKKHFTRKIIQSVISVN